MSEHVLELWRDAHWLPLSTHPSEAAARAAARALPASPTNTWRVREADGGSPVPIVTGGDVELQRDLSRDQRAILLHVENAGHVFVGEAADLLGDEYRATNALRGLRDKSILSAIDGDDFANKHVPTRAGKALAEAIATAALATQTTKG